MNKKEWKEERRKWRLINKSTFPHEDIRDENDSEMVRDYLFNLVYRDAPRWFWNTRPNNFPYVRKIVDRFDIRLNIEKAPNSYPHPTKNP